MVEPREPVQVHRCRDGLAVDPLEVRVPLRVRGTVVRCEGGEVRHTVRHCVYELVTI